MTDPRLTPPRPAYRGIAIIAACIVLAIIVAFVFKPSKADSFFGKPQDTATVRTP